MLYPSREQRSARVRFKPANFKLTKRVDAGEDQRLVSLLKELCVSVQPVAVYTNRSG